MSFSVAEKHSQTSFSLPAWLRQDIPDAGKIRMMREVLRARGLHTVCESAHCPNTGTCWSRGVATVMILGNACTRRCGFCAVEKRAAAEVDAAEPENVARLVEKLSLRYIVVTSVTRDDLSDGGAGHFAKTVRAIKAHNASVGVEVLIPDFQGAEESLKTVLGAGPDVVAHNMEMARRLFSDVRPEADYGRSLKVLRALKRLGAGCVKTGMMVGLGETDAEIKGLLRDIADAGCSIVTIGQYLAPSKQHVSVKRFVPPEKFQEYQQWAEDAGIPVVVSGPLVRSSYLAEEGFHKYQDRSAA